MIGMEDNTLYSTNKEIQISTLNNTNSTNKNEIMKNATTNFENMENTTKNNENNNKSIKKIKNLENLSNLLKKEKNVTNFEKITENSTKIVKKSKKTTNKNKDSDNFGESFDDKLNQVLLKRALGYECEEIIEEFIGDSGELKLIKRKVTKKDVPPDIGAVKILLDKKETSESLLENLTDEELENLRFEVVMEVLEELDIEND